MSNISSELSQVFAEVAGRKQSHVRSLEQDQEGSGAAFGACGPLPQFSPAEILPVTLTFSYRILIFLRPNGDSKNVINYT